MYVTNGDLYSSGRFLCSLATLTAELTKSAYLSDRISQNDPRMLKVFDTLKQNIEAVQGASNFSSHISIILEFVDQDAVIRIL